MTPPLTVHPDAEQPRRVVNYSNPVRAELAEALLNLAFLRRAQDERYFGCREFTALAHKVTPCQ